MKISLILLVNLLCQLIPQVSLKQQLIPIDQQQKLLLPSLLLDKLSSQLSKSNFWRQLAQSAIKKQNKQDTTTPDLNQSSQLEPRQANLCAQKLTSLISSTPKPDFQLLTFIYLSGKNVNDLGKYKQCTKNPANRYLVLFIEGLPVGFYLGICAPVICNAQDFNLFKTDIVRVVNKYIGSLGTGSTIPEINDSNIKFIDSQKVNERSRSFSAGTVVTVLLFSFFILMVIISTIIEVLSYNKASKKPHSDQNKTKMVGSANNPRQQLIVDEPKKPHRRACYLRFLGAFGCVRNYKQLMAPTTKGKDDGTSIFNGIRVLSIAWVILGHTWFYFTGGALVNPQYVADLVKSYRFTWMQVTPIAVDVFFMMTGFLGAYIILVMTHNRKGKKQGVLKALIHRYLRLLPLYVFVMLFFVFLVPLLASGPLFFRFQDLLIEDCRKAWWAHFLYINNFYYPRANAGDYCMGWTWYLPNDFQFFLLIPTVVPIYYKNPKLAMIILGVIQLICLIIEWSVCWYYNMSASLMKVIPEYFSVYYHKPWNRISPFMVGVFLAFMYYTYKYYKRSNNRTEQGIAPPNQRYKKPPCFWRFSEMIATNWIARWGLYILGAVLLATTTMLNHSLNNNPEDWNKFFDIFYVVFSRPAFVIGMLCIVYPSMIGQGKIVNAILGWYGWTPFAKVSYAAYLVHPVFMNLQSYNSDYGTYASWPFVIVCFLGYFTLVYSLSIFLSMTIEFPFINLEKEFLFKDKKEKSGGANKTAKQKVIVDGNSNLAELGRDLSISSISSTSSSSSSGRVYGAGGLGAGSMDVGSILDRSNSNSSYDLSGQYDRKGQRGVIERDEELEQIQTYSNKRSKNQHL